MGADTQRGRFSRRSFLRATGAAGGAALIASGIGASKALSVAISVGALGIFSGAAIFLFAVLWSSGLALAPTRFSG